MMHNRDIFIYKRTYLHIHGHIWAQIDQQQARISHERLGTVLTINRRTGSTAAFRTIYLDSRMNTNGKQRRRYNLRQTIFEQVAFLSQRLLLSDVSSEIWDGHF